MDTNEKLPEVGSIWEHRNGNQYEVTGITNLHTEDHDKYPITVNYRGQNLKTWSRRLVDWHCSMTELETS